MTIFENDAVQFSSFVEGQTRSLKVYSFLNGVMTPERHATNGWIIVIGNQGAPRDCDSRRVSNALYGLCVCHFAVYSRCAPVSLRKEDDLRSPVVHLTGGILRHFRAFSTPEQNPAPKPSPSPARQQVTQAVGPCIPIWLYFGRKSFLIL